MAESIGMTIPFNSKIGMEKDISNIAVFVRNIERALLSSISTSTKKSQKMYEKNQKFLEEFFKPLLPNTEEKSDKPRKHKLLMTWEKYIIKNKFLDKITYGIVNIGKKLGRMAENSFLKILGFLLAMAIFDPEGKLLSGLVSMLGKALNWAVKVFLKWLPIIIERIIHLIKDVFPRIISEILQIIFPQMSKTVSDFIGGLGSVLFTAFFVLGGILKLVRALNFLYPILKAFFVVIKGLATFLIANPIIALIAAVVVSLVLLYKYSEKVSSALGKFLKWYDKLGESSNFFANVLHNLLMPFKGFIIGLKNLADLFSMIKKYGIKKTAKIFKDMYVQWLKDFKKFFVKTIPNFFVESLKAVGEKIKNIFKDLLDWLVKSFWKIVDWISIHLNPKNFFKSVKEKEGMLTIKQIARETGLDYDRLLAIAKGDTADLGKLNQREKETGKELTGIMNPKQVDKFTEKKVETIIQNVKKIKDNNIDSSVDKLGR